MFTEREEESIGDDGDDDSIVTPDHESETHRSQTGEEPLEVDNGSDIDSGGYSEREDSDE